MERKEEKQERVARKHERLRIVAEPFVYRSSAAPSHCLHRVHREARGRTGRREHIPTRLPRLVVAPAVDVVVRSDAAGVLGAGGEGAEDDRRGSEDTVY